MDKELKQFGDYFYDVLADYSNETLQGREGDAITREIIERCNFLGVENLNQDEKKLYLDAVRWRTYSLPTY